MPRLGLPSTPEEHDLWVRAVIAGPGISVEGIDKRLKSKLQKRFTVSNGKLICRETNKRVFLPEDFNELWETHHIKAQHPGLKGTLPHFQSLAFSVPSLSYDSEGRKRGWKIHSSVMAPGEVDAADNGEFPSDIIDAAPATRAYFNHLARLENAERIQPEAQEMVEREQMEPEQSNDLYLLYRYRVGEPETAVAIGKLDVTRRIVHGKSVTSNEGAFEVVTVLDENELGPDGDLLQPKSYLIWPLNRASKGMGNSEDTIRFRSGMYQNYLRNTGHQRDDWMKCAKEGHLVEGDHVLLPIQRVDRSNTCPRTVEGRVMQVVSEKLVRIGTKAGVIETAFRHDQLHKVTGNKRKFDVPTENVSLIKALRLETTYGSQIEIVDKLRLISLNTGYCDKTNFWIYLNETDPDGTLAWLVEELTSAERLGQKVQILGHIPPGSGECMEGWAKNYYRIVNRFESTTVGQFAGHMHTDSFTVYYEDMDNYKSRPTNVMYVAPSVTTFTGLNPSYRIYTLDGAHDRSTYEIFDHETWFLNLTKANESGRPRWKLLYRAKHAYRIKSLRPVDWNELIFKLKKSKKTVKKFMRNYVRRSDYECDETCRQEVLCSLRSGHHNNVGLCNDLRVNSSENEFSNETKQFSIRKHEWHNWQLKCRNV